MSGYLGAPLRREASEIATGDIGEIDVDGYVYVRGRRRNRFITSFGRNITPEWVENELLSETPVLRAMVLGEARPHAVALIWPIEGVQSRADRSCRDSAPTRGCRTTRACNAGTACPIHRLNCASS